ncbi:hypothetical protein [Glutamicibacter nicotianae]|uniref:hypothetical protein n=1 Tax=Glutamicibacter nicotianae TaxID=37929 RepID=UPI0031E0054F
MRETLRMVSRSGHSQAESMCEWPMPKLVGAVFRRGGQDLGQLIAGGLRGLRDALQIQHVRALSMACRICILRGVCPSCSCKSKQHFQIQGELMHPGSKTARSIGGWCYGGARRR